MDDLTENPLSHLQKSFFVTNEDGDFIEDKGQITVDLTIHEDATSEVTPIVEDETHSTPIPEYLLTDDVPEWKRVRTLRAAQSDDLPDWMDRADIGG